MHNKKLRQYLIQIVKEELKWMYDFVDINNDVNGVETDKYKWCKDVLEDNVSIQDLLNYFTKYYSNDEKYFINKIKELEGDEE